MVRADFTLNRSGRRGRRRLLYATLLVVLLVLLDIVSGGKLRALAHTAASGVWSVASKVSSVMFGSGYFVSHASLAAENAALRDELTHYQEQTAAYTAAEQENSDLRALVHLAAHESGITAPVVSSVFSSPYGTFLVGAGSDSVHVGDIVMTPEGFVAGVVTEVQNRESVVKELFAPGETVNVLVGTAAIQASGRGGGNARATVARDIAVSEGEAVYAPEYGGRPVGVVGKVESSPSDAGQSVYINLPVGLTSLRFVYMVRP
jgi:cell shape-determining protein MreC